MGNFVLVEVRQSTTHDGLANSKGEQQMRKGNRQTNGKLRVKNKEILIPWPPSPFQHMSCLRTRRLGPNLYIIILISIPGAFRAPSILTEVCRAPWPHDTPLCDS